MRNYLFTDSQNQLQNLAFVQYAFNRNEHPIELKPHGNKKDKPFCRSKPSTLQLLKESAQRNAPRKALQEVENIRGGVLGAQSGCDLPRNHKQIYNLNYAKKYQHLSSSASSSIPHTDVLAQVMRMCKESSGLSAFVRSVEAAPEPMCILASDQQLADIERFCTGDLTSVLSIDPTFNLATLPQLRTTICWSLTSMEVIPSYLGLL